MTMKQLETLVENHYYKPDLYEDILGRLEEQGVDIDQVLREHIAGVDEFHIRGSEVSRELAAGLVLNDQKVLDLGCGIGGPARMLAAEFNCKVTGIDLSHEFIRTAKALSSLVGLQDKTEFIQASALDLPFEDEYFDMVWTQHVQMNIEDKRTFYSEAHRVLKQEGKLVYYDIFRKIGGDLNYPLPWAENSSLSFLDTNFRMIEILHDLGFKTELSCSQTSRGIRFLTDQFEKQKMKGPVKLGLNVLMGISTKEKLVNILKGLIEGKIDLRSGILRKTGTPGKIKLQS